MGIFSKLVIAAAATTLLSGVASRAADGWIIKNGSFSVEVTTDKLVAAIENAGAKVFARVDHAAGAQSIDAQLEGMTLVMFGNPNIGTPILQAEPRTGLELPNRVLIWDENGQTKIGYVDPAQIRKRYSVEGADEAFSKMADALGKLTDAATQ